MIVLNVELDLDLVIAFFEKNLINMKDLTNIDLFIFLSLALIKTVHLEFLGDLCPIKWSWNKVTASCTKRFHFRETWPDARKMCQLYGADLVTILSRDMQIFLNERLDFPIGAPVSRTWIGLNDLKQEGVFRWLDTNEDVKYFLWGAREPDGGRRSNCGQLEYIPVPGRYLDFYWVDRNCKDKAFYICERPQGQLCPPTWSYCSLTASCFKYFPDKVDWHEARQRCRSFSGDLVISRSSGKDWEITNLYQKALKKVWIGASNLKSKRSYLWLDFEEPVERSDQFLDAANQKYCVQMSTQKPAERWTKHACSEKASYVCEIIKDPITVCQPKWTWSMVSRTCLKFFEEKVTWYTALDTCRSHDAELLMVLDEEMTEFLNLYLGPSVEDVFWMGLNQKKNGVLRWSDYIDQVTYTNFYDGEDATDKVMCVQLGDLAWSYQNCSFNESFVCEKFAENCEMSTALCPKNCTNCYMDTCNRRTGGCHLGCQSGYYGLLCDKICVNSTWGRNCQNLCSPYCAGSLKLCEPASGKCLNGCMAGYRGDRCDTEISFLSELFSDPRFFPVLIILIIATLIAMLLMAARDKRSLAGEEGQVGGATGYGETGAEVFDQGGKEVVGEVEEVRGETVGPNQLSVMATKEEDGGRPSINPITESASTEERLETKL